MKNKLQHELINQAKDDVLSSWYAFRRKTDIKKDLRDYIEFLIVKCQRYRLRSTVGNIPFAQAQHEGTQYAIVTLLGVYRDLEQGAVVSV